MDVLFFVVNSRVVGAGPLGSFCEQSRHESFSRDVSGLVHSFYPYKFVFSMLVKRLNPDCSIITLDIPLPFYFNPYFFALYDFHLNLAAD